MKKGLKTDYLKRILTLILSMFFMTGSFFPVIHKTEADNNVLSWIFCEDHGGKKNDFGRAIYKGFTTDAIPFELKSKSAFVNGGSERVEDNVYNKIMMFGGYQFGERTGNAFDLFGFSGLKLSSYGGEWKYTDIDPCVEDTNTKTSNYGQFYKGRYEPQEAFKAAQTSDDIRSTQMVVGSPFKSALKDNLSNMFLGISRLITSITIALIGLSFGDVSSKVGFTGEVQANIFNDLFTGLFQPLMFLMFIGTVIYLMYHGLFKRQFRVVLQSVIKIMLIMLVAFILVFNPRYLMTPVRVANFGQAILVSAITPRSAVSSKLCSDSMQSENGKTGVDGKPNEGDSIGYLEEIGEKSKKVLGCRMWSEFAFKPWIKAQWNEEYENLDDLGNSNDEWTGKPTVDLGNGNKITNWALFQISTQTSKHKPLYGEDSPYIDGLEPDWWRIVDATSNVRYEKVFEGSAGGASGSISSADISSGDAVKSIWKHFRKLGYTDEAIAGMLGNFHVETGGTFDPGIVQNGHTPRQIARGQGHGLAQWTDSGRLNGLIKYAESKNKKWYDLDVQIEYIEKELSGPAYSGLLSTLKSTNNVDEATKAFCDNYEIPQNCNGRAEAARGYYENRPSDGSGFLNNNKYVLYNRELIPIPLPSGDLFANDAINKSEQGDELERIKNWDITSANSSKLTGANIDAYLKKFYPNSMLIGYGDKIIEGSEKYGINAALFMGQISKETVFAQNHCGGAKNNFGCIRKNSGGWMTYDTPEDYINSYYKLIKENYVDKGLTKYGDYLDKYSPAFENDQNNFAFHQTLFGDNFDVDYDGTGRSSSGSGSIIQEGELVEIVRPVEPTPYWNFWIGNESYRVINSVLGGIVAFIACLPILVFALISSVYSVGLTLLMALAPVFLMFGLWQGKGEQIFLSWLGTVFSVVLKKILAAFMMMLSVFIMTRFISIITYYGYIKAIITISAMTYILISQRNEIISRLGTVNLPGSGGLDLTGAIKNASKKVSNAGAKAATLTGGVMLAGAVSAAEAQKAGASKKAAVKTGVGEYITDKMRASNNPSLRYAANKSAINNHAKGGENPLQCHQCGNEIGNGSPIYHHHETGEMICQECYDSGLFDTESYTEMSTGSCAYCGADLSKSKSIHQNTAGEDVCSNCYEMFNFEEGQNENKMGFTKEDMERVNSSNIDDYIQFSREQHSLDADFNEWLDNIQSDEKEKKETNTDEELMPYVDEDGNLQWATRREYILLNTGKNKALRDKKIKKKYKNKNKEK